MRWYRYLYMGKRARKDRLRIISNVRLHRCQPDIYVVTLASNPLNLLDIYPSKALLWPYYRRRDDLIVGIAKGYQEAVEIVVQIVTEVCRDTGGFAVRDYFEGKSKK